VYTPGLLRVDGDIQLSGKHAFRGNDPWLRFNQDGAFVGVYTPGLLRVDGDIQLSGKHAFRGNDPWLRFNQDGAFVGVYTPGLLRVDGDIQLSGKHAFRGNDTWLRLNQDGAFPSGVHTPHKFAPMSLNVGGTGPQGWDTDPGPGGALFGGEVTVNGAFVHVNGAAGEAAYIGADGAGGDVEVGSENAAVTRLGAWNRGNGTWLDVSGRNWIGHSDIRAKRDVAILTGALQKVLQLRAVSFRWQSDPAALDATQEKTIGMIAQEVQKVLPGTVIRTKGDDLGISYQSITALLIEAVKDQNKRIDAVLTTISELRNSLSLSSSTSDPFQQ
jgi:hypothetical protein